MGLKDWLANKAGPSGYAAAFGSQLVKDGIMLGRFLFLSHGVRRDRTGAFVFQDPDAMRKEGFSIYCADSLNLPPLEDCSELSRQARIAGLAFASQCAVNAASNFMTLPNARVFQGALGKTVSNCVTQLHLAFSTEDLLHYVGLRFPPGTSKILNLDMPGDGDVLFVILQEVGCGAVGFVRDGATGFDNSAVPLASEYVRTIASCAAQYGW